MSFFALNFFCPIGLFISKNCGAEIKTIGVTGKQKQTNCAVDSGSSEYIV